MNCTATGRTSSLMQTRRRKALKLLGLVPVIPATGLVLIGGASTIAAWEKQDEKQIEFHMVRSAAAEAGGCLADATARVTIESKGPVEHMDVHVSGLPPKTEFDFFVLQI